MKKQTKIISVCMALALAAPAFSGCKRGGGSSLPTDKTIIFYQNYDCGYGSEYIEETCKKFAEAVKDVSYEEGKTGVYFEPYTSKTDATGKELVNSLSVNENYIYFTEFTMPQMLKNSGYVMDISSWLNETSSTPGASRFAEKTSIKERMYDSWRDYVTEDDGSMYCIPLFESTEVFTYDKDLCESKKLYIAEGSTDGKLIFVKSPAQKKQKGVDGIAGTEDDGLPETYAQLYLWFNAMKSSGVKPMTWSGMFKFHIDNTLQNYWADFEGPENVKRCYTFDGGSDSTLIDTVDENGNITYLPATAITTENGYMVQRQEGRYRALSVAKKIAENANDWVNSTSFLESESHTLSQATYINSRFTESPIMLFAHGSYWEAEATPVFKNYESQKSGKADRHFGVLPIPKYSRSEVGKATTVVSDSSTAMFVKSGLTGGVLDAVKDFVIYFNNQENMGLQNKYSASPRPFTYELSDELKATMTDYEISLYDFYKAGEKKNVVYTAARNDFFMANFDEMHKRQWVFASKYKSNSSTVSEESVVAFKNEPNVTLKQYFDGLYNRFTADDYAAWKTMLRKIG